MVLQLFWKDTKTGGHIRTKFFERYTDDIVCPLKISPETMLQSTSRLHLNLELFNLEKIEKK